MIVTKIRGGLGNQLFTYAAGRSLALENDTDLLLDISWYAAGGREFLLDEFCIEGSISRQDHSGSADGVGLNQPQWNFELGFRQPDQDRFISGWWQSERFFEPNAETIKQDLQPRDQDVTRHAKTLTDQYRVDNGALVSIHCRRGDYVHLSAQDKFHLIGAGYYDRAKSVFPSSTRFIVFSDDPEWCEDNLADSRTRVVDVKDPVLSFVAMQSCDHHIIANSTFSWWAAWLSETEDTIVVTPPQQQWFGSELAKVHDTSDMLPQRWIRVEEQRRQ
jgi:hypothetical protein